ncbi:hemicentin-2 isoform X2 [Nasonia vitripennis]|uniref:Ig-like domain-containing protein n=1 Tax=Nasonia vitripennis TaxID=7425 RepID=A0A7M7T8I0_NASVI|nr:hemicentin-2 isoform X2 [Nasonia vitripennis]
MGRSSRSLLISTFLAGTLLTIALLLETSGATRLKQRGSTESPRATGVNEAGVYTLRGKQDGGSRRGKRTTTTTTTTTPTTELPFSSSPVISRSNSSIGLQPTLLSRHENDDAVVEPAALLGVEPQDAAWRSDSSNTSGDTISLSMSAIDPPIELVVKPLSKVVLPCELEGNSTKLLMPAVRSYRIRPASWLHEGVPVDMITIDTRTEMSGTGHRYIGDSSTAALHIDNVRLEDDGTWKCQLEDDRGKLLVGRPVKLVVLEAPRGTYLLIDGRRLDPGNQFVPVKEGSELTLECAAEGGNPAPILAWGMTLSQATLDGPEQPPDNLTIVPATSPVRSGAHLKVLRGHHNATIICVARHVTLAMPMNASILLDVQYTPSFAITRLPGFGIPIVEGMSVSLKCEVDSNPSSAPIWQRDNGLPPVEQSDDGWLNFTKISRAESGWYKCYTRHMLGIFTSIGYFLNVRYDPEIETEAKALNGEATDSRKMEVQIGGAVTLECDGGCWGHGPGMDPIGGPGPLALSRVVYQEAGEYRCVAPDRKMQDTWRAQLPYHIKVVGRPMLHPLTQSMTTNEGETLDVTVEFCAEPNYTKVVWMSEERVYLPGGELRDGVRALPIEDGGTKACYRSVLRFERVQRSHAGEWMLLVRSPEGLADASVSLNVTLAAGYSHAHVASPSLLRILSVLLLLLIKTRP